MATDPVREEPELDVVEIWAKRAIAYAHHEGHWIDLRRGETREKHAEYLRFKERYEGWSTALIYWYLVEINKRGEVWRHLSIACSQSDLGSLEAETIDARIVQLKGALIELFEPIVRLFFPTSKKVATHFHVDKPVPVGDPTTRQVSFRIPLEFHFMVPWSVGDGPVVWPEEKRKNIATCDPRILGWKPGSELPSHSPQDFPFKVHLVLAWRFGRWAIMYCHDGAWYLEGQNPSLDPSPHAPQWWRELPEPPETL